MESLKALIKEKSNDVIQQLNCDNTTIQLKYDDSGSLSNSVDNIFSHSGIYSFILKKGNREVIVYIGKNEGGDRLRQHITGENKDGTKLKPSVKTKHNKIKESITAGFDVYLSIYENCSFDKATLAAIEIGCIEQLKSLNPNKDFPNNGEWNDRIS